MAVLEAGLVSTPVVATRVGGIPEFLVDRVHGLLCAPDEPALLANAVRETLENRTATAERTRAFAEQAAQFTWAKASREYQDLCQSPGPRLDQKTGQIQDLSPLY